MSRCEVSYDRGTTWLALGVARIAPGGLSADQTDKSQSFSQLGDGGQHTVPLWTVTAGKQGYIAGFSLFYDAVSGIWVTLNAGGTPIRWFFVSAAASVEIDNLGVQVPAGTVLTIVGTPAAGQLLRGSLDSAWEN
jgi:hypothetical protein